MAINNEHDAVLFNGPGGWHPNTTKIIVGRGASNEGNRVITDKAIYFMQWDDTVYHIIFKKYFSEIRSVKPSQYLNKWFVLQTGDTQSDMFAFPFDSDKTEHACTCITQQIQQNRLLKKPPEGGFIRSIVYYKNIL